MSDLPTIYIREPIITDDGRAYSLMRDPTPGAVAYVPATCLAAAEVERDEWKSKALLDPTGLSSLLYRDAYKSMGEANFQHMQQRDAALHRAKRAEALIERVGSGRAVTVNHCTEVAYTDPDYGDIACVRLASHDGEHVALHGEALAADLDNARAALTRVTEERDAALSRVAALEAALLAEVRALVARNDYTPGSEGYASRQIVIEELRAILSGGTAALEARVAAKVAKAVEAERAAIRKRVEAVRRMEPALDPDGEAIVGRRDWGRLVYRDDVIAAIGGAS